RSRIQHGPCCVRPIPQGRRLLHIRLDQGQRAAGTREPTMLDQIKGLHHVTSMARDAAENNTFFTNTLGLRRVKKTVNFDAPDVYHLYYGDEQGTPGSVMTYFPFPNIVRGRPGTGEVGTTVFSVPSDSLGWWETHLAAQGVQG